MADDITLPKDEKPEVKLDYTEPDTQMPADVLIDDSFGIIPNISATPTFKPRKMIDQLRVQSSSLWVYDAENDVWFQLEPDVVYAGLVNGNGTTGTPFPTGWSINRTATGIYVVTHNLGTTSYVPVIHAYSTSVRAVNISSVGTNAFTVTVKDSGGTDTDNAFYFFVKDES